MRVLLLFALTIALGLPASAQYDEESTEDQRLQDERYYQRYLEQTEDEDETTDPQLDEESLAQAFLEKADRLIRDKNYRSRENETVRVQTDDPRLDLDAVQRLFVAFHEFFDEFWAPRLELRAYDETSRIFLFYSYYKYNQLIQGDWRRSVLRPKGHYGSLFDAVVIHTDSDRSENLPNTLIHEVAHQLVEQRIFGGTGIAGSWLSEGLATYYEYTAMDPDGSFHPGEVGGKEIALFSRSRTKGKSDAKPRLASLRRALKTSIGEGLSPVDELLHSREGARFYSGDVISRYSLSWLLVHYLLHGQDGAHAEAFARYLQLEAEGQGDPTLLVQTVGLSARELDAALLQHLDRIKLR